jgi:hypothetical protein
VVLWYVSLIVWSTGMEIRGPDGLALVARGREPLSLVGPFLCRTNGEQRKLRSRF